jgi:quercetin dioxygenase-like cupin family protein
MNKEEIRDLTPEGYPVITRTLWRQGMAKPVTLRSGATLWPMGGIENVSAYIIEGKPGLKFEEKGHPDEVFVYVLEGLVLWTTGRNARKDEAIFNCPNTPYSGQYVGTETIKLLVIRVSPKPGATPADPALMKKVIRVADVEGVKLPFATGTLRRRLVETGNFGVSVGENWPVMEFEDKGHWDPEIVFGLEGKLEYLDGRTVRPGDMVTNAYNVPHPGRYAGLHPRVRVIECSTSLYRKGAGNQITGELLPGYINGWHNQTLAQGLALQGK